VLLAAGLLLGWAASGPKGAIAGALVGVALGAAVHRVFGMRAERREQARAAPFPPAWRDFLLDRYDHYARLPAELRPRFDLGVQLFLADKRISGIGVAVDDELRLLVAASAVTLSLGWPDFEWDQLTEVLLYPQDFDRDYGFEQADLSGQAHVWGTVILSAPALQESFAIPDDAYHVGIHEFAHLLDMHQAEFDGIPLGLPAARHREWLDLVERERRRMLKGKSVIDDYGADDPVEFLAVAVEAFFEAPLALRKRHAEVYAILADYFRQDPARWDDERYTVGL
jgi:Mlc titration factor MtfA (ptsG expression regulator)